MISFPRVCQVRIFIFYLDIFSSQTVKIVSSTNLARKKALGRLLPQKSENIDDTMYGFNLQLMMRKLHEDGKD